MSAVELDLFVPRPGFVGVSVDLTRLAHREECASATCSSASPAPGLRLAFPATGHRLVVAAPGGGPWGRGIICRVFPPFPQAVEEP